MSNDDSAESNTELLDPESLCHKVGISREQCQIVNDLQLLLVRARNRFIDADGIPLESRDTFFFEMGIPQPLHQLMHTASFIKNIVITTRIQYEFLLNPEILAAPP
jgi:hypothetical protein